MAIATIHAGRGARAVAAAFALALASGSILSAWDNHEQISALALASQAWKGREVKAENLDDFLSATKADLSKVLLAVETKARKDYPSYRPLPAALVFDPSAEGDALHASFIGAIRVNPERPITLFLQVPVGGDRQGRPELASDKVALGEIRIPNSPFVALSPGEAVTALEVVETACDEPDYGMDFGLYQDNGTAWGARYGFGIQPWGNAKLSYGTQAPFHMSFDNEPGILHALAKWTTESNSGYRIDLYSALSRFAFASGHEYWGWRFAGWALHYVQDLTQPYHASIMPSKSTFALIMANAFGSKAEKDGLTTLVSNRHLILENYQYSVMAAWKGDASANPVYAALAGALAAPGAAASAPGAAAATSGAPGAAAQASGTADVSGKNWAIGLVAREARARGPTLDRDIVATFPAKYVNDPSFDFGAWQSDTNNAYDPYAELMAKDPAKVIAFDRELAANLKVTGEVTRRFMEAMAANIR